jgi:FkbM family methyltransferase
VTSTQTKIDINTANQKWGELRITGWKHLLLKFCHNLPPLIGMKRMAMWARKPLKVLLDDWVDATIWGLRLRLFPKGNLSEQRILFLPQFFDRTERLAIADSLAGGGVFLDIGANIGAYSFWAASLGSNIRVEAFEPDPELCQRMQFNLSTNNLHNVHINQIALGKRCGTITLERDSTNRGRTRVVNQSDSCNEQVPIKRLPDFLNNTNIKQITALKIDVEGNEVSVLAPLFEDSYRNLWPEMIICELEKACKTPDDSAPWKLLVDSGYVLIKRTKLNGIFSLKQKGLKE